MKFDYKRYGKIPGKAIERPVIPVLIRNPRTKQSVGYEALAADRWKDDQFPLCAELPSMS